MSSREEFIMLVGKIASEAPADAYVKAIAPLGRDVTGTIYILFEEPTLTDSARNWLYKTVQEHGYVITQETVDFDRRTLYLWVKKSGGM